MKTYTFEVKTFDQARQTYPQNSHGRAKWALDEAKDEILHLQDVGRQLEARMEALEEKRDLLERIVDAEPEVKVTVEPTGLEPV